MCRWFVKSIALSGMSVAVALGVFVAGTVMAHPAAEGDPPEWWPVSECYTATIVALGKSGVTGSALLCMADNAVRPAIYVSGLTPGQTYSALVLPFEHWLECGSPPCDAVRSKSGSPRIVGHLGDVSARSDGTTHFRGHFDGWSLRSGADVTLLVTRQGGGDGAPTSAPISGLSGFLVPRHVEDAGSAIALASFRLP